MTMGGIVARGGGIASLRVRRSLFSLNVWSGEEGRGQRRQGDVWGGGRMMSII
jgi:hypothetical protein